MTTFIRRLWRWGSRFAGVCVLAVLLAAPFTWRQAIAEWRLSRARIDLRSGDAAGAVVRLESAQRLRPRHAETHFLLGRALRRTGKLLEAREHLERAQRTGWPAAQVRDQLDLISVQAGRFDEAEHFLSRVLAGGCDDEMAEEVYEARAKGFLFTYRLGDALLCLNFWIEWQPRAVAPRMMRADIWERCERLPEAIDEYRGVLLVDPEHVTARRSLAQDLLLSNLVDEALIEFENVLTSSPHDVGALLGRAQCRHRMGQLAAAEQELQSVLEMELPDELRAEALVELGKVLLLTKGYEAAIVHLEDATRVDPRNRSVYYLLGMAYTRAGRPEDGAQCFDKGQRLNEQYVRLAEITRRLITSPADAEMRFEAGEILIEQGLEDEGAAWLQTALLHDPAHDGTHRALAAYFARQGNAKLSEYHHERSSLASEVASEPADVPPQSGSR